jgi:hypothetical protein
MRVILEKADVIALLGKAMKRKLSEADVEVHADPFEVVIHDATGALGVDEEEGPPFNEPVRGKPVIQAPPEEPEDDGKTLEDMARESAALAAQPPKTGKGTKKLKRNLMPGESLTPRSPLEGDDNE